MTGGHLTMHSHMELELQGTTRWSVEPVEKRKENQYESIVFKPFLLARHCVKPLEGLFHIILAKLVLF